MNEEIVYLNPICRFIDKKDNKVVIMIDEKIYDLSGDNIYRYFICHLDKYIAPRSIENLKKECGCISDIDIASFDKVINELFSRNIIIKYTNYNNKYYYNNYNVLFLNFSNNYINKSILKSSWSEFTYKVVNSGEDISNFSPHIVVFFIWRWNELIYRNLIREYCKKFSRGVIFLPVILNDNYFSMGPHFINGDEEMWQKTILHLNNEESRSAYSGLDCCSEKYMYVYPFIDVEIKNLYNRYYIGVYTSMKSLNRLLSFNYNSFKLKYKKYI